MPDAVRIIEVGPRDGLQNEPYALSVEERARFITELSEAGLREIEVGSFVSPKWVPQMARTADLWKRLPSGPRYTVLVPNARGLADALEGSVRRIAVFTSASDAFNLKNVNRDVRTHLGEIADLVREFRAAGGEFVRGYVSTITHDPYSGPVAPDRVAAVASELLSYGCDEVSLGETLGGATTDDVAAVVRAVEGFPKERVVWHFHDTHGRALDLVALVLDAGYRAFDSSAGGLGGCPYAPGAGGNLATEKLVSALEARGFSTGVDLAGLMAASARVRSLLARASSSTPEALTPKP